MHAAIASHVMRRSNPQRALRPMANVIREEGTRLPPVGDELGGCMGKARIVVTLTA
jgi:hypothetical protein